MSRNDTIHELEEELVSRNDSILELEERVIKFLDVQIAKESLNDHTKEAELIGGDSPVAEPLAPQDDAMDDIEEEITTINANKTLGYNREGPQNGARPKEPQTKNEVATKVQYNCTECIETRPSDKSLASHIRCHVEH